MIVVPKEQDVMGEYPNLRQHWVIIYEAFDSWGIDGEWKCLHIKESFFVIYFDSSNTFCVEFENMKDRVCKCFLL